MNLNWGQALKNLTATVTGVQQGKLQAQDIAQQRQQQALQQQMQLAQLEQMRQRLGFDREELGLRTQEQQQRLDTQQRGQRTESTDLFFENMSPAARAQYLTQREALASGKITPDQLAVPGVTLPVMSGVPLPAGVGAQIPAGHGIPSFLQRYPTMADYNEHLRRTQEGERLQDTLKIEDARAAAKAREAATGRIFQIALARMNNDESYRRTALHEKSHAIANMTAQGWTREQAEQEANRQFPGVDTSPDTLMRLFRITPEEIASGVPSAPTGSTTAPAAPDRSRRALPGPAVPEAAQGIVGPGLGAAVAPATRAPLGQAPAVAAEIAAKQVTTEEKKLDLRTKQGYFDIAKRTSTRQDKESVAHLADLALKGRLAQEAQKLAERKFTYERGKDASDQALNKLKLQFEQGRDLAHLEIELQKANGHGEETKDLERALENNEKQQNAFKLSEEGRTALKEMVRDVPSGKVMTRGEALQREHERLMKQVGDLEKRLPTGLALPKQTIGAPQGPVPVGEVIGPTKVLPSDPRSASVSAPGWDPAKREMRLKAVRDFTVELGRKPTPSEANNLYRVVEAGAY
jgi:hypothetical protein